VKYELKMNAAREKQNCAIIQVQVAEKSIDAVILSEAKSLSRACRGNLLVESDVKNQKQSFPPCVTTNDENWCVPHHPAPKGLTVGSRRCQPTETMSARHQPRTGLTLSLYGVGNRAKHCSVFSEQILQRSKNRRASE
jgi:hypothetical protein